MADNITNPPISSGVRIANDHMDWLLEFATQFNALNGEALKAEVITFVPSDGTGYYRIGQFAGVLGCRVRVFGAWNDKRTDVEFSAVGAAGAVGHLVQHRCLQTSSGVTQGTGVVSAARVSGDGTDVFLDINVADATTPGTLTVLVEHDGYFTPDATPAYNPTVGATYNNALTFNHLYGLRTKGSIYADGSTVLADALQAGASGSTRGIVRAYHGGGSNTPGVLDFYSKAGTEYYGFFTDAGRFRRHTALPTADTNGFFPFPVPLLLHPGSAKLPSGNPAVAASIALSNVGGIELDALEFDQTTEQTCHWVFPFPALLDDGSSCNVFVVWIPGTGASAAEQVAFRMRGGCVADNVDPDTALGSWGAATLDAVQTVGRIHVSGAVALTIANGAAGRMTILEFGREPGNASDNMAGKARVVGLMIQRG
jgi:hypothetical protein